MYPEFPKVKCVDATPYGYTCTELRLDTSGFLCSPVSLIRLPFIALLGFGYNRHGFAPPAFLAGRKSGWYLF